MSKLRKTQCVCAAARRTARAVTQFYDLVLAPTGLKATQFITLQAIADAGELAQWQLSREYAISTETLSRRLNIALKKGLLEVRRGPKRGERLYKLTPLGYQCLEMTRPHWHRAQNRFLQALGNGDIEWTIECLDRITHAAQAAEDIRTRNPRH